MNATQEAIIDALPNNVKDVVAAVGKSETTVRKALKELAAQGEAELVDGEWRLPEKTGKKKYKPANPTTPRTDRKNRITKAEILVMPHDAPELSSKKLKFVEPEAKWVTVCVDHQQFASYDYILEAYFRSSWPSFCKECSKKMSPEQRKKVWVPKSKKSKKNK